MIHQICNLVLKNGTLIIGQLYQKQSAQSNNDFNRIQKKLSTENQLSIVSFELQNWPVTEVL